ncbi:unnamed protein product [Calicophoron daubneyi]|uniref:Transposase n=1 Tax=Calicophoron daubneyi TaxID=300641 RepID=A0AAV2TRG4_CALDB
MGFAEKLRVWMPHELNEDDKENRLQIASQHLARHRTTRGHKQRFLYRIVTEDENWCLFMNMKQRKEWFTPGDTPKSRVKPDLHPKKAMVRFWWDWEGMVYCEMFGRNVTVTKVLYIAQLHRVKEAMGLKRPHQQSQTIHPRDNARRHVAQVVKATFQELEWEVLQHPSYSPDLAPTDQHLFRSLSNHMRGVTSDNEEDLKNCLDNLFVTRLGDFWRNGIEKLVKRWEEVVNDNGECIIG